MFIGFSIINQLLWKPPWFDLPSQWKTQGTHFLSVIRVVPIHSYELVFLRAVSSSLLTLQLSDLLVLIFLVRTPSFCQERNPTTAAQIDLFMSQKPREDVKLFKNWQTRNGTQSNLIQPVLPSNKLTKFRCSLQTMPSSAHKHTVEFDHLDFVSTQCIPKSFQSFQFIQLFVCHYIYILNIYIYIHIYIHIFAP